MVGRLSLAGFPVFPPLAHDAILLADVRVILEPDLDGRSLRQVRGVCAQRVGEVF